jgi:hypothetical protein
MIYWSKIKHVKGAICLRFVILEFPSSALTCITIMRFASFQSGLSSMSYGVSSNLPPVTLGKLFIKKEPIVSENQIYEPCV